MCRRRKIFKFWDITKGFWRKIGAAGAKFFKKNHKNCKNLAKFFGFFTNFFTKFWAKNSKFLVKTPGFRVGLAQNSSGRVSDLGLKKTSGFGSPGATLVSNSNVHVKFLWFFSNFWHKNHSLCQKSLCQPTALGRINKK